MRGCTPLPLLFCPVADQEDVTDLLSTITAPWQSGIQARALMTEKKTLCPGGASPERTIPHTTDNITYKEVITNEN